MISKNLTPLLTIQPIGRISTSMIMKFDAPHQPDPNDSAQSVIELFSGHGFESALEDLEGFDYIWLIWWFHKNDNWRPMVRPPRGDGKRRGVFATRSPHRPNPLGMTAVPLLGIEKEKIFIGSSDLIDGTPILDIKPYLPRVDSFPEASSGWVGEMEEKLANTPDYELIIEDEASKQLEWLKQRGVSFIDRAAAILKKDPYPHKTRRITQYDDHTLRMGCGAWRIFFRIEDRRVYVRGIASGYPKSSLEVNSPPIFQREVLLDFLERWE